MSTKSNYRSILYFDAIRRHHSVREAARRLGIAASAVNRQLLGMEEELGMPLFERLPEGMRLTAAGELVARHALAVLHDERRVISELDALRGLKRGEIAVAAAESLNSRFMPDILERIAARYPGVKCRVRTVGSNEIPELLKQGDADIGLAFSLPRDRAIERLAVKQFHLGAFVRPDHPLTKEVVDGTVTFTQCLRFPLVLPGAKLSTFSLLEPSLRRFEGRYQMSCEVDSVELMKTMTRRLNHVAFLSRLGLEQELLEGTLVFLPLARSAHMTTELGLYVGQGRPLSVALDLFVAMVREKLSEYPKEV